MNFTREALDRLRVRLNMYLVSIMLTAEHLTLSSVRCDAES